MVKLSLVSISLLYFKIPIFFSPNIVEINEHILNFLDATIFFHLYQIN